MNIYLWSIWFKAIYVSKVKGTLSMESYNIPLGGNQNGEDYVVKIFFPFQVGYKKFPFIVVLQLLLIFPYFRGMYEGDMGTFRIFRFKRMNSYQNRTWFIDSGLPDFVNTNTSFVRLKKAIPRKKKLYLTSLWIIYLCMN